MVQKKLNKKRVILAGAVLVGIIIIIIIIISSISNAIKKSSIEYKLGEIGYTTEEIEYIKANFTKEEQNKLLDKEYDSMLIKLYKEKYFKKDKLNEYLEYHNSNKNLSSSEIVTIINTHTNIEPYEKIFDTDVSKKELMLVNKYYKLSEDYKPEVELISSQYAYSGKYASKTIIESLQNLIDAAKEDNLKLIVAAGYRSYKDQEKIYEDYKLNNGIREADEVVSRPGHSDYQTGLAVDIEPYAKYIENISESEEYQWLLNNMHKYGFIQRFPEGKEDITGFKYSAWHLRYVGIETATYIHDNNITFEEYYGYKF